MARRAYPSPLSLAIRRAYDTDERADQRARFLGSERYLRMYSRFLARMPSTRQAGEQYTRGCLFPPCCSIAPPQTRHLGAAPPAALGWEERASRRRRRCASERRLLPFFRHSSEQYRTTRLAVPNARPHSLQGTRTTRDISLAVLALHGSQ